MWFTQDGLHPERNFQSFYDYIIQQNERIQLATHPHALPPHSLTISLTQSYYNPFLL